LTYLQYLINTRQIPSAEACALSGEGVFDCLNMICNRVLANLAHKQKVGSFG
jgi:hypothetical protein